MKPIRSVLLAFLTGWAPLPVALGQPTADGLYAGFVTQSGSFWARLEFERAPRTVANFVGLAEGTQPWLDFPQGRIAHRPFYDGLTFHRVMPGFMIQGGSPNAQGTDGPGYRFADEFRPELRHSKDGILSMANSGPNSNGSQFFVTVTNTPWLDDIHSVFGEVIEGLEVVHELSKVPTGAANRPLTPLVLDRVEILRIGEAAQAFNPALVEPRLPEVVPAPLALSLTPTMNPTNFFVLLQPRPDHTQHVFFSSNLREWFTQSFGPTDTSLNASNLLNEPHLFFRVVHGGYER